VVLYKWLGLFKGRLVFVESVNPAQVLRSNRKAAFAYQVIHRHADAVVHISKFGYDYARLLGMPNGRSHYIPNIVATGDSKRKAVTTASMRLLAVGRLDVVKGYDRLIMAMPSVVRAFPGASLRICGDGDQKQCLQGLIGSLGLASRVELLGHVDDVAHELRQADMFLQTSHFEGMPNALIEALAAGLPVVTTTCGGSVRRLMLQLGAGQSVIGDDLDFDKALLAGISAATNGSINWAEVDARFAELHNESRNFTYLMKLCLSGARIE
jgi:glycosyltransferase involved in cell wall biosynthesis